MQSPPSPPPSDRLFETLKRLLALDAISVEDTLTAASSLLVDVLAADKVDAFVLEPASRSLVALGVSDTAMGRLQQAVGLDRLPLANGGRAAEVFTTGDTYHCNDVEADLGEVVGIRETLGVQSSIAVPFAVAGERRGVLQVVSARPGAFDRNDLEFLVAVAHWVGVVAHRAELVETLTHTAEQHGRQTAAEELLVVFSHDLRNHLWTVSLRLQALSRRAALAGRGDDVAELEKLAGNIQRLKLLSRDLLDAERLERGLFVLVPTPVDVAALVRDTAGLLATAESQLQVTAPDSLVLAADAPALRQALENLVGNAHRHSPPGAPVQLELREDRGAGTAALTIRDAGPGIAPELLPRLFTRFTPGHGSTGLGLGLYLARKLVEAQGGTLDLVRPEGPGACFRITLPLTPEQR